MNPGAANDTNATSLPDISGMIDIIDIKPPVRLGGHSALLYGTIAGAVLLCLIMITGFLVWRKKRARGRGRTAPSLPPDMIALRSLAALRQEPDIEGKEYYFRLSAILRHYIEGRFGICAPEMTTEELLPSVDALDIEEQMRRGLRNFLRFSDPVKFSDRRPDAARREGDATFVHDFVKATTSEQTGSGNV